MITCTFENKHKANLRHVVVDAIIVKGNKILLVKRGLNVINPGKLAFPGGFLDRDETTAQAVLREVKEETGYLGKIISLFRIIDDPKRINEDRQNVTFVYLIKVIKKVSKPDKEIVNVSWYDLDKLPPAKEFAFDHYEIIKKYQKYLEDKVSLPIFYKL